MRRTQRPPRTSTAGSTSTDGPPGDVGEHPDAPRARFLRMKLRGPDLAAPDDGGDLPAVVHGGRDQRGVRGDRMIRVDEVRVRAGLNPREERGGPWPRERGPAHVRDLHPPGEADHAAGQDAEPPVDAVLLALLEQQLHPKTDPEERPPGGDIGPDAVREPRGAEARHRRPKRAVAGDDERVRLVEDPRRIGDANVEPLPLQPLLDAAEVAGAVIDHRDPARVPLVEGLPCTRGASRVARSSASAVALKAASMMWCAFRPWMSRRCSVIPAFIAKARKNSSVRSVS